ncbi:GNAT family N-acetyltransferase [Vibrio aestuarianus]|uniref:GNAT family N-acetyltransferase n=1 Tax=Vibrio aestuarianus TaxID=28171 RepID=UPI00237C9332|nr:GNAT family N-acetyltransferase [Vibrio aestuarianus]MDE1266222.1 GNAT family N-acetyltransferase [Vibrio aestuarianus]MDE1298313.1 GNAT family N-acetyltransferase [Vibrio aestuarianus]
MYQIYNVNNSPKSVIECAKYIHSKWGSQENYLYFENAILNSSKIEDSIPQFYVLVNGDEIVGCFGLIINDFVSRHDLYPWFSSLFIEPVHRGNSLSKTMFDYASKVVKSMGYSSMYLTTDHDGLYEKFGWERIEDAYEPSGEATRVYRRSV